MRKLSISEALSLVKKCKFNLGLTCGIPLGTDRLHACDYTLTRMKKDDGP